MAEQTAVTLRSDMGIVAPREKRTPDELISEGTAQAKALMKVVKEAGLSKDLGGNKPHLEVEAWQTIGRFNGYLTDILWTKPIVEAGEKVGYEARAELVRIEDGVHVIGAEASCFFDEVIEKRDGTILKRWNDDYAVKSMAQTRAQSKLGRMAFAWVAVLAGFSGTPAEEMEGVRRDAKGRKVVFPFGKHKDAEPSSLSVADLHHELSFWEKKTAEETNPRFKANNERLVAAIKEALAEKTAPVGGPGDVIEAEVVGQKADVDPDAIDRLLVRVQEIKAAKQLSSAKVVVTVRKAFGKALEECSAEELESLIAELQAL